MAKKKKAGKNGFWLGMLLYALVFLVLLLALIRPLWSYLAAYEESGPDKAMERYLDSMDEEHVRALAGDFFSGLELRFQNEQQAFEAVRKIMSGELRYALKSSDTDLRHATYSIRSGNRLIGSVSIAKGEDPRFGFAPWKVESESYDFSSLLSEDEITVPDNWTVLCGGTALGESDRVGEPEPFELVKDLYGDSRFTLPQMVTYRVEGVVGEAPFTILDREGREVPRGEELSEEELLANCSAEEEEQIRTLLDGFLQRYIDCLSNASRNITANYNALKPYIVANSAIDKLVRDNMEGQQWAHSHGDTVTAREDLLMIDLGGGYYMADMDYTLDTVGNKGHVESVNRLRVIMSMTADGLRAVDVYSF